MALDFPTSPALNQVYTFGSYSWRWDGTSWVGAVPIVNATINNTTIGAVTPSTGAFTTITANTSAVITGGASIGQAAFQATGNQASQLIANLTSNISGAGTSFGLRVAAGTNASDYALRVQNQAGTLDYLYVRGDGSVSMSTGLNSTAIGATTPSTGAFTTLSATTATVANNTGYIAAPANTVLHIVGANGTSSRIQQDSYGSNPFSGQRQAEGTAASPTATINFRAIGLWGAAGYGATGFGSASTGTMAFNATENFTDSAQGTNFVVQVTPNGSTTRATVFTASSTGLAVTGALSTLATNGVNTFESAGVSSVGLQFRTNSNNRFKIETPSASADLAFYAGGTTETVRLTSSGNVGIGTASPAVRLHVDGGSGAIVSDSSVTASQVVIGVGTLTSGRPFIGTSTNTNPLEIGTRDAQPLIFVTNSSGRARITSGGELLVGVTTADAEGGFTLYPQGSSGAPLLVWNRASTANSTTAADFRNASSSVGNITYTNTTTLFTNLSDHRRKSNVKDLTGSGAFIDALKPRTFDWDTGDKGVGFIAHEFAEVSPSSVSGEKDAVDAEGKPIYQAMQASSAEVIANVVAELKSLRARVAALESK